jgi:YHS domain-containing protein
MTEKCFNEVDPVCGMELILCTTMETAEFEGKTYGFCSKACKDLFVGDPKKYIDNPASTKTMPAPKDIPEKPIEMPAPKNIPEKPIDNPPPTEVTPGPKDIPEKPTIADPLLTGMTPKPKDNPDKD